MRRRVVLYALGFIAAFALMFFGVFCQMEGSSLKLAVSFILMAVGVLICILTCY